MSSDIGGAGGLGLALYPDDKAHCDEAWFANDELFQPDPLLSIRQRNDPADFIGAFSFRTPWWPAAGVLIGEGGADVPLASVQPAWGDVWTACGCNGRYAIAGVTRDQYGSVLPNCTVKLFRTSDDQLMSQVTSDANGEYLITTPYYPDAHYLVVYKTGTPDTFGTTVNTLVAG